MNAKSERNTREWEQGNLGKSRMNLAFETGNEEPEQGSETVQRKKEREKRRIEVSEKCRPDENKNNRAENLGKIIYKKKKKNYEFL